MVPCEGPGVSRQVVCGLSVHDANDPYEKLVVSRSQPSEVLLAEGPRYTPAKQGLHHLGL